MHQTKQVRAEIFIRKELLSILMLGAIAFFTACEGSHDSAPASQMQAAVPDTPEADRERLLTRVNEYWQARVQRDTKVAFQYELPTRRQKLDEDTYSRARSAVKILEFSIIDLQVPLKATEVSIPLQLKYEYIFPMPGARPMEVPTQITDRWEKDQGVWYHVLDTNVIANKSQKGQTSSGSTGTL